MSTASQLTQDQIKSWVNTVKVKTEPEESVHIWEELRKSRVDQELQESKDDDPSCAFVSSVCGISSSDIEKIKTEPEEHNSAANDEVELASETNDTERNMIKPQEESTVSSAVCNRRQLHIKRECLDGAVQLSSKRRKSESQNRKQVDQTPTTPSFSGILKERLPVDFSYTEAVFGGSDGVVLKAEPVDNSSDSDTNGYNVVEDEDVIALDGGDSNLYPTSSCTMGSPQGSFVSSGGANKNSRIQINHSGQTNIPANTNAMDDPDSTFYSCHTCKRCFYNLHDAQRHNAMHHNGKHVLCKICGKMFQDGDRLRIHAMTHSSYVKCQICSKVFKNKKLLLKHEQEHLDSARPFKCEICTVSFVDEEEQKAHQKKHEKKERLFECIMCSKTFRSKKMLNLHQSNGSCPLTFYPIWYSACCIA